MSLYRWLTGRNLTLRLTRGILLTKGTIRAGNDQRIGWFLNVYVLGKRVHYMGRRNGRFYRRTTTSHITIGAP